MLGITDEQNETETKNTMNTKPLSKKLKSEVNLQVGEMRKELKETIDSTIQNAIATGMEKMSQSTAVLVQEMFVGLAKQQLNPEQQSNKKTQCQPTPNNTNAAEDEPKPSTSGYIKPSTSGHVKSTTSSCTPEKQQKEVEFSKFSRGKEFQTRIKSIQLRMRMVGSKDDMKNLFRNLTQEVYNDLDEYNMELCRFTLDENPQLDGRCCKFYQFNGCIHQRTCKEPFIHPEVQFKQKWNNPEVQFKQKWNNNRQNSYGNRNQNPREQQRNSGNTETNYFIHACSLCLSMRKGYSHHPLFKCEMLLEFDNIAQDPRNYVPVLMIPKNAKTKLRTIKTDPQSNFEENIVNPQLLLPPPLPLPLPRITMRPNQDLLTSNIKHEIVEIDD